MWQELNYKERRVPQGFTQNATLTATLLLLLLLSSCDFNLELYNERLWVEMKLQIASNCLSKITVSPTYLNLN
jgi:hypothetical protein